MASSYSKNQEFQEWLSFYAKVNWKVGSLLKQWGSYDHFPDSLKLQIGDKWMIEQEMKVANTEVYRVVKWLRSWSFPSLKDHSTELSEAILVLAKGLSGLGNDALI